MQCERAQEFFSDYLERTLDRPMAGALESHLGSCATCREEVEALQQTLLALESVPEVEPPWDGAWQVIRQIRAADAERAAAQRPWNEVFSHWLRSLNPMSAAMGAGLATLVIAGALVFPGMLPQHMGMDFVPLRARTLAPIEMPEVGAAYNAQTEQVVLTVKPKAEMPAAQVRLDVAGQTIVISDTKELSAGLPLTQPVVMHPSGRAAESVWMTVSSRPRGAEYTYLVVVPLQQRTDRTVTLAIDKQPVDEALRQLAPYLDRPVVAAGVTGTSVTLGVDAATPGAVLQQIADQTRTRVETESDVIRLVPPP